MTSTLTSKFFTAALAVAMLASSGQEAWAQKNAQRLWTGKQPNLTTSTQTGSFAKINALISKPGNSQDFVTAGGGTWQLNTKSAYTYDTQGRLTQRIYTEPNTNQNLGRETNTYDAKGNETEYRVEIWDGTAWTMDDGYKSQITYNSKGNKTDVIYEYWDPNNNVWVKDGREQTAYDANDLVTSLTYSSWNGSTWEFDDRMLLSHVGGVGTSALMQEYNNGTWTDAFRAKNLTWHQLYEIPSAYVLEVLDNNTWVNEEKYSSVYDANGGHVGIYEVWTGTAWLKSSRETEFIDSNKNYTGWKEETWDPTANAWN